MVLYGLAGVVLGCWYQLGATIAGWSVAILLRIAKAADARVEFSDWQAVPRWSLDVVVESDLHYANHCR